MAKTQSSSKQVIKIVFDTNALYSGSAHNLLNNNVRSLIVEQSSHSDVLINWFLPEIVKQERQYQMVEAGLKLLPSIQKLETLLGHNLNITESIVRTRVDEAINRQLDELHIGILDLNTTQVDWNRLIFDAVSRRPPFQPGEKEKGFRDAIIVETFLQLVATSSTNPRSCQIVLVSEDALLSASVKQRCASSKNVRVLTSIEECKELINIRVANVGTEFIAEIHGKATKYFFDSEQTTGLYFDEKIRDQIRSQFGSRLTELPSDSEVRENGTWYISPPRFMRKERQRVFWVSRIAVKANTYKWVEQPSRFRIGDTDIDLGEIVQGNAPYLSQLLLGAPDIYGKNWQGLKSTPQLPYGESGLDVTRSGIYQPTNTVQISLDSSPKEKVLVATGESTFEVTWSVTIRSGPGRTFSNPRIEKIDFVKTTWDQ